MCLFFVIYLIQVSNISIHCSILITIREVVCDHHILVQHSTKYDFNKKSLMFNTSYHLPHKISGDYTNPCARMKNSEEGAEDWNLNKGCTTAAVIGCQL
jgi:hypothetical protein